MPVYKAVKYVHVNHRLESEMLKKIASPIKVWSCRAVKNASIPASELNAVKERIVCKDDQTRALPEYTKRITSSSDRLK